MNAEAVADALLPGLPNGRAQGILIDEERDLRITFRLCGQHYSDGHFALTGGAEVVATLPPPKYGGQRTCRAYHLRVGWDRAALVRTLQRADAFFAESYPLHVRRLEVYEESERREVDLDEVERMEWYLHTVFGAPEDSCFSELRTEDCDIWLAWLRTQPLKKASSS